MQSLVEKFRKKLMHLPTHFQRSLMTDIAWEARLIGIKGARGIGINRETLLAYLHHLAECGLIRQLYKDGKRVASLLYCNTDDAIRTIFCTPWRRTSGA